MRYLRHHFVENIRQIFRNIAETIRHFAISISISISIFRDISPIRRLLIINSRFH